MIAQLYDKIVKWQNKVVATNNFITEPSGGVIYYNGVHRTHVYFNNGIFYYLRNVPSTKYLDASIFCIAGGGTGGEPGIVYNFYAGGGGAGGLSISNLKIKNTSLYTIYVGAGGANPETPEWTLHRGAPSYISEDSSIIITANGGGGGDPDYINGEWKKDGGSGGGVGNASDIPGISQPGTPIHYGHDGSYGGGGSLTNPNGQVGGDGMILFLTDASIIYAAGGSDGHRYEDGYRGLYGSGGYGGKYGPGSPPSVDGAPGKKGLVAIRYKYQEDLVAGDDWSVININTIDGSMYENYALHGGYFYDTIIGEN